MPRVYGIRDLDTGEWLMHWTSSVQWKLSRVGRAVFMSRERAKDVRDCWRYRKRSAVLVVLRPLPSGRYA